MGAASFKSLNLKRPSKTLQPNGCEAGAPDTALRLVRTDFVLDKRIGNDTPAPVESAIHDLSTESHRERLTRTPEAAWGEACPFQEYRREMTLIREPNRLRNLR